MSDKTTENPSPRNVQVATVVWGFILIGIAAGFFAFAQFDLSGVGPGVIIAWIVLGIGALAIVGGLLGALFRHR
jgi:hypothetical protein